MSTSRPEAPWSAALKAGLKALDRGDYEKAQRQLGAARRQADEATLGPEQQASTLAALAALSYRRGRYGEAHKRARRAVALAPTAGDTAALAQAFAWDYLGHI